MKSSCLFLILLFLALAVPVAAQTIYGLEDVNDFRAGRDKAFRNRAESPLLNTDFAKFEGLSYFEIDENFKIAATFKQAPDESYFLMPTTTGESEKYKKVGELAFELDGTGYVLSAYQSEKVAENEIWNKKYGHTFFIPFLDLTNGESTYGGGRYLSMKIPASTSAVLDFNLAYNPSCAYGRTDYSCPIPPRANKLDVSIEAGEKKFAFTKSSRN